MVWFNYITAFRTILDDAASCANGRIWLTLVPSNVALKLTNARTAPRARIAPALRVRSLTQELGSGGCTGGAACPEAGGDQPAVVPERRPVDRLQQLAEALFQQWSGSRAVPTA